MKILLNRLNEDPEIAFVVPDGPLDPVDAYLARLRPAIGMSGETVIYPPFGMVDSGYRQRWKCVRKIDLLRDGDHSLWHIPTGQLPLIDEGGRKTIISDPWAGWTEVCPGGVPMKPYLAGSFAEIRLSLSTRHRAYSPDELSSLPMLNPFWNNGQEMLVASCFGWIGGSYGPAPDQTQKWWRRLRAFMERSTVRLVDQRESFWAFPSAFERLKGGIPYEAGGWNLDESIRNQ